MSMKLYTMKKPRHSSKSKKARRLYKRFRNKRIRKGHHPKQYFYWAD